MRFTSNINNAVTNSLDKVEKKPNIYHFNFPKQEETLTGQEKLSKAQIVNVTRSVETNLLLFIKTLQTVS